jgi:hypothetical protein
MLEAAEEVVIPGELLVMVVLAEEVLEPQELQQLQEQQIPAGVVVEHQMQIQQVQAVLVLSSSSAINKVNDE